MRYEQLSQPPKVNDSIKKEGMKPTIPEAGLSVESLLSEVVGTACFLPFFSLFGT